MVTLPQQEKNSECIQNTLKQTIEMQGLNIISNFLLLVKHLAREKGKLTNTKI